MELFQYKDYDDYIEHQKKHNKIKLGKIVYVREYTINDISNHKGPDVKNILCHGTRDASEQKYFKKRYPEAYIIGSEVGPSAQSSPMTIEHDFNKQREEWVNKFDIVYSNSYDHSITPVETLEVWKEQLNDTGLLYLEYAQNRSNPSESDPLGATDEEVRGFISQAGLTIVEEFGKEKKVRHGGKIFICKRES